MQLLSLPALAPIYIVMGCKQCKTSKVVDPTLPPDGEGKDGTDGGPSGDGAVGSGGDDRAALAVKSGDHVVDDTGVILRREGPPVIEVAPESLDLVVDLGEAAAAASAAAAADAAAAAGPPGSPSGPRGSPGSRSKSRSATVPASASFVLANRSVGQIAYRMLWSSAREGQDRYKITPNDGVLAIGQEVKVSVSLKVSASSAMQPGGLRHHEAAVIVRSRYIVRAPNDEAAGATDEKGQKKTSAGAGTGGGNSASTTTTTTTTTTNNGDDPDDIENKNAAENLAEDDAGGDPQRRHDRALSRRKLSSRTLNCWSLTGADVQETRLNIPCKVIAEDRGDSGGDGGGDGGSIASRGSGASGGGSPSRSKGKKKKKKKSDGSGDDDDDDGEGSSDDDLFDSQVANAAQLRAGARSGAFDAVFSHDDDDADDGGGGDGDGRYDLDGSGSLYDNELSGMSRDEGDGHPGEAGGPSQGMWKGGFLPRSVAVRAAAKHERNAARSSPSSSDGAHGRSLLRRLSSSTSGFTDISFSRTPVCSKSSASVVWVSCRMLVNAGVPGYLQEPPALLPPPVASSSPSRGEDGEDGEDAAAVCCGTWASAGVALAFELLAHRPSLVSRMFVDFGSKTAAAASPSSSPAEAKVSISGAFVVRVFDESGMPRAVLIDDTVPCQSDFVEDEGHGGDEEKGDTSSPADSHDRSQSPPPPPPCTPRQAMGCMCADTRQLWMPLLEKALAKVYGGYHALSKLSVADVLYDLLGPAVRHGALQHALRDSHERQQWLRHGGGPSAPGNDADGRRRGGAAGSDADDKAESLWQELLAASTDGHLVALVPRRARGAGSKGRAGGNDSGNKAPHPRVGFADSVLESVAHGMAVGQDSVWQIEALRWDGARRRLAMHSATKSVPVLQQTKVRATTLRSMRQELSWEDLLRSTEGDDLNFELILCRAAATATGGGGGGGGGVQRPCASVKCRSAWTELPEAAGGTPITADAAPSASSSWHSAPRFLLSVDISKLAPTLSPEAAGGGSGRGGRGNSWKDVAARQAPGTVLVTVTQALKHSSSSSSSSSSLSASSADVASSAIAILHAESQSDESTMPHERSPVNLVVFPVTGAGGIGEQASTPGSTLADKGKAAADSTDIEARLGQAILTNCTERRVASQVKRAASVNGARSVTLELDLAQWGTEAMRDSRGGMPSHAKWVVVACGTRPRDATPAGPEEKSPASSPSQQQQQQQQQQDSGIWSREFLLAAMWQSPELDSKETRGANGEMRRKSRAPESQPVSLEELPRYTTELHGGAWHPSHATWRDMRNEHDHGVPPPPPPSSSASSRLPPPLQIPGSEPLSVAATSLTTTALTSSSSSSAQAQRRLQAMDEAAPHCIMDVETPTSGDIHCVVMLRTPASVMERIHVSAAAASSPLTVTDEQAESKQHPSSGMAKAPPAVKFGIRVWRMPPGAAPSPGADEAALQLVADVYAEPDLVGGIGGDDADAESLVASCAFNLAGITADPLVRCHTLRLCPFIAVASNGTAGSESMDDAAARPPLTFAYQAGDDDDNANSFQISAMSDVISRGGGSLALHPCVPRRIRNRHASVAASKMKSAAGDRADSGGSHPPPGTAESGRSTVGAVVGELAGDGDLGEGGHMASRARQMQISARTGGARRARAACKDRASGQWRGEEHGGCFPNTPSWRTNPQFLLSVEAAHPGEGSGGGDQPDLGELQDDMGGHSEGAKVDAKEGHAAGEAKAASGTRAGKKNHTRLKLSLRCDRDHPGWDKETAMGLAVCRLPPAPPPGATPTLPLLELPAKDLLWVADSMELGRRHVTCFLSIPRGDEELIVMPMTYGPVAKPLEFSLSVQSNRQVRLRPTDEVNGGKNSEQIVIHDRWRPGLDGGCANNPAWLHNPSFDLLVPPGGE